MSIVAKMLKSLVLALPIYFCKKEIKQTFSKIVSPTIKCIFSNIKYLFDVFCFFLVNSFDIFYYTHWKIHEHFFNKFYQVPKNEYTFTPFIHATQFEAFSQNNIPVVLSFHNIRNLRSFGIYLSKTKTINLDDIISFCNLPKTIVELKIAFSPFISNNHNYLFSNDRNINLSDM